ncbi:MAG: amidase family protein, partial [Pseudomonadota bacterium]
LDTVGPLTRNVDDASLVWAALADAPRPDIRSGRPDRLRMLVAETTMLDDMPDPRRAAFERAVDAIADAGVEIMRGPIPEFAETLAIAAREGAMVTSEGYAIWRDRIEASPDMIWERIRDRFRSGAAKTADQAERARFGFQAQARAFCARIAAVDAVLAPTTPTAPPDLAKLLEDGDFYVTQNLLALRNTRIANFLGLPALTLPAGDATDGLPAGLMLIGRPHDEARLLRLGRLLEPSLAEL